MVVYLFSSARIERKLEKALSFDKVDVEIQAEVLYWIFFASRLGTQLCVCGTSRL